LKQSLGARELWAIAVGLVISGEYFGWSFGWASAGTLGFLVTTLFVAALYTAFVFCFTELTTAIPDAGGPFAYGLRAFGDVGGYIAGAATLIEFVFAPPAIALAIGAYLHVQFPALSAKNGAALAYLIFMLVNVVGVRVAASLEFLVTVLAIGELLVFMGVVAPGAHLANFVAGGWAGSNHLSAAALPGMFAAVPFAVWFFLGIEGVAMAAEEAKRPERSIPVAYLAGMGTLLVLAFGVMIFAGSVGDWHPLASVNDPLPMAMRTVVGPGSPWLHTLVWLGLFGLVASLHGLIIGYSRQIFALARGGFLPSLLGRIHPKLGTPWIAIVAGGAVGIAAIYCDDVVHVSGQSVTANIVTLSVLGALVLYGISMLALFQLRRAEPQMHRPFRVALYPWLPLFTLLATAVCFVSIAVTNPVMTGVFAAVLVAGYLLHRWSSKRKTAAA
jgi:ethanolamine permease